MLQAGAERIGTSSGVQIINELKELKAAQKTGNNVEG
jgi:deoxyribose-phosphate aldolase